MKICNDCGGKRGCHRKGCPHEKKCPHCGYSLQSRRHDKNCPCFSQEKEDLRLKRYEESCIKNIGVPHNYFLDGHQQKMCLAANRASNTIHISKLNRDIAAKLHSKGVTVEFEHERFGHFFDLCARSVDKELLIERNPTVTHNSDTNFAYYRGLSKVDKGGRPIEEHCELSKMCLENGVELIQWFDWYSDVKMIDLILKKLSLQEEIDARECEVKKVPNEQAQKFINKYALSPNLVSNEQAIGLFYCDELVALMTHRKGRVINYACVQEMSVKHALEVLTDTIRASYDMIIKVDFNLYTGKEIEKLGGKLIEKPKPHLTYAIPNQKSHIAEEDLKNMDKILPKQVRNYQKRTEGKTQEEALRDLRFVRVFDSGYTTWRLGRIRG